MKYNVYFTDLTHTGIGVNSKAFPFGIGLVAAYAAKKFGGQLAIDLFKFPENLNKALQNKTPHLLCMSNFCYNINLSYAFAREVKKAHPEVIVIFGGPNIPALPIGREAFLKNHPAIDFYIKWDGEVAFVNLLEKLLEYDLKVNRFKQNKTISENCLYLTGNDYIEGPDHSIDDFKILPSPYTTGMLDKFFDYSLNPLFETTRGCPYSCTYCNDGNSFRAKIVKKPQEGIIKELEYIASKIDKDAELWICDDNFGMFKEDIETSRIINFIIEKYGWPSSIRTSNGKSHPERIVESRRIINQHKGSALRFGTSLQSTDTEVLKNIKRKNLPAEKLLQLTDFKHKRNNNRTAFFTELILALPGDSLEKHYNSLQYSIDVLEVSNIDIHQLNLLSGAEMADLDDRLKYEFNIRYRIFVGCFGIYKIGDKDIPCAEIDESVVSNSTLSFEDYIECRVMNLLVKIYIDHAPFKEVIGLIRKLDLSVFELLRILKEKFVYKYDSLSNLITEFVKATKRPLFKNRIEITEFVSQASNIKKYISGKLGGNELLNSKAKAFLDCGEDLHLALKESALYYLKKHNLLTQQIKEYIEQAVEFSRLRKFDIHNINTIKESSFTFDFIEAGKKGYEVDPSKLRTDKIRVKFFHDKDALDYINERFNCWGKDTLPKIGKLLQKTNVELMSRQVLATPEMPVEITNNDCTKSTNITFRCLPLKQRVKK